MDILTAGYRLPEAPTVDPDGSIWFTDVLGGGVMRLAPSGEVETVVAKRRGVGGTARHRDGGIVISGRDVVHVETEGTQRTVFAAPEGVTGFNDLTALPDGRVLVGALRYRPIDADAEPVTGEFVAVGSGGGGSVAVDGIDWPNGVAVSPDGTTVYCCDYLHGRVVAADVTVAGAFTDRRTFAESPTGHADGLAVDANGTVHVATGEPPGIARFSPDGDQLGVIEVPAGFTSSLCFAGEDGRDLVVTVMANALEPDRGGALLRSRVDVPGAAVYDVDV